MSAAPGTVDINTQDVKLHIPPGRKRAPFFRYVRFNLPRLTKAAILAIASLLGVCAGYVALGDHEIFPGGDQLLWGLVALAALFVLIGAVTKFRIWDFGLLPAFAALLIWGVGVFQNAPFVWNGAGLYEAAAWNTMMVCAIAYLVIHWALNYGVLVAYPDDQGFTD
ncbi:hypothetical protein [Corynebacterium guangdongense]|uniref:Uncharacterized protein n=1 Tax=Corynebacterium guangdongense TaxID=1783348 RepID=A0ABU1ZVX8_9CORY|nr:hypothetical protein [Corynebacterium guangdongense]MDR7329084.1 hypothetical protein [Corynebacterium guangdongense]WJZ17653.1 hypothetical protein CGUA_05345 [Corynebacterium guangdongense]